MRLKTFKTKDNKHEIPYNECTNIAQIYKKTIIKDREAGRE
jgi:hypothetical protein